MASNSGSPASSPVPPPVSVPNGHFVNGESGQVMSQAPHQMPPGAGPPPPQHGGYPPYGGGYGGQPIGAAQKPMMPPGSGGGYPPPQNARFPAGQSMGQQGGATPTLNSLLQGRNQRMPSPGQPGPGPYGPPPQNSGGYPQPWPNDPNYAAYRQPHPGHRPPYGPSAPQQSPYPGQYGMPPQQQQPHPGYQYPPHGRYPPPPAPPGPQPSNPPTSPAPAMPGDPVGGPPPHPGRHEGKPSVTWTPPVQNEISANNNSSQNPPPQSQNLGENEDESGGGDPQRMTPGLRPTPSPTGSSSSRSMSPAVNHPRDQQPQTPSDVGNGPNRGYQQPPMGPPGGHMMYNQKGGAPGSSGPLPPGAAPPPPNPAQQQMAPYGGQPNYANYGPRPPYGPPPAGYPPGAYGRSGPSNIPPGYPGYPGAPQYSGNWNNSAAPPPQQPQQPGMMPASGKGAPSPGATGAPQPQRHPGATPPPPGPGQYPPRPQQQPQMKGYPPQGGVPPPPNNYNGPPMYNGPSMAPPGSGAPPMYNGPPHQAAGYPGSYPNSHPMNSYGGLPNAPQGGSSPATSSTPTGPDGVPLHDETSQQSTLSQSSDRSDGRQTPKAGPGFMGGPVGAQGYPPASASPHSSAPSPGGSLSSSAGGHDSGYPRDISSPNWQRPPQSPASQQMYNSNNQGFGGTGLPSMSSSPGNFPQAYPETTPSKVTKGSKGSESLARIYEMDDNPERRMFLDRLLSLMEDRGTPITQCPTISKNPLDLFKLYVYTREKGGYLECTKNKTWKDIAAQLGIGASSSGAYTLKKHYGKNLLPYECHFDRGGLDPAPILAQVEAQIKKKSKGSLPQPPPAPSPGSQDSRDSYSNSSDPYGGFSSGGQPAHNSYPPPSRSATSTPPSSERPPSHPGSGYPPAPGYSYPPGGSPGGYPPSAYPPGSTTGPRPGWPGYGPPPPNAPPGPAGDTYGRPGWQQPPSGYGPRPPYPGPPGSGPPTSAPGPAPPPPQPYPGQPPYQDQYQGYGNTAPPSSTSSGSYPPPPGAVPSKPGSGPPPPPPSSQPPRPGMPPNAYPYQRPPMYPGGGQSPQWQNRYPAPGYPQSAPPQGDRSWPPPPGSPGAPPRPPGPGPQWSNDRTSFYGSSGSSSGWNSSGGMMAKSPMRPPYRPDLRGPVPSGSRPGYSGGRQSFPPGVVESTPPYMLKRRKLTKMEVQPVDGWRLVMALRSGLLMESTWALDVINILLYDDSGIAFFGLGNMPGLLEALLDHWRASLIEMFGITEDLEVNNEKTGEKRTRKRWKAIEVAKSRKWFERKRSIADEDEEVEVMSENLDLGKVGYIDPAEKQVVLTCFAEQDLAKRPRFVDEDLRIDEREDELFVRDETRGWDLCEGSGDVGMSHWLNGGGHSTDHIVTHFKADLEKAIFTRVLTNSPNMKAKKESKNIKSNQAKIKSEIVDESGNEDEVEVKEDIVDRIHHLTGIVLEDPGAARQRWNQESLEDENYVRDEPSLQLVSEANDNLGKRAVCISTILRNLSFVPGNEYELSKSPMLLAILGKLILLHHWYPTRAPKQRNYDRGEEEESAESCSSLTGDDEWWWDYLHVIRENVLVILANISGALDLEPLEEEISRPILDGLLEWAVSSSSYAQDPFPNVGPTSPVSPQRCAIEALCKLCLSETNIDLMLATPPFQRLEKLVKLLAKKLYRYEDQVLREFSINLLYYLSAADNGISRIIAMSETTVSLLLSFIEQAEQNALVIAQQHGVNALRDNPDSMGTSLDMLRRAANTLSHISRHVDNIALLARHEQRLLSLVMSQILDQGVAAILSQVLYNIGAHTAQPPPPPSLPATPTLTSEATTAEVKSSS